MAFARAPSTEVEIYRDMKDDHELTLNLTKLYLGIPKVTGSNLPEFVYASPSTRLDRIYVLNFSAVISNQIISKLSMAQELNIEESKLQ